MVDYLTTVAVSVTAAARAVIAFVPGLDCHRVSADLFCVALLMVVNLRGVREAGAALMVPTYLFIGPLRLPRDHYVRLDANDHSVHPTAVGRRMEVTVDLDRVRAFCDGQLVADQARCWARHQTITDPVHTAAAQLRHQRAAVGVTNARQSVDDVEEVKLRCLADYDRAFGLDGHEGVA